MKRLLAHALTVVVSVVAAQLWFLSGQGEINVNNVRTAARPNGSYVLLDGEGISLRSNHGDIVIGTGFLGHNEPNVMFIDEQWNPHVLLGPADEKKPARDIRPLPKNDGRET